MRFDNSNDCMLSQLDILTVPDTQSSLEDGVWSIVQPNPDFERGTIIFNIPGNDTYLDLAETELLITCSIRKEDASDGTKSTPITNTDKIGPVNNFLGSLFSQAQVSLNDKLVENTNDLYAYRSYLENLLNYDDGAKKSFLQNQMFFKDKATLFDSPEFADVAATTSPAADAKFANDALVFRKKKFVDSKIVQLKGKLHSNIFNMNKYLLSNTKVTVTLTRSKASFCLFGTEKIDPYDVYIHKALLRVRRVKVKPSIELIHQKALESQNAIYPYKEVILKSVPIAISSSDITIQNIHNGNIPNRIIVGFVDTDAYTGKNSKNPYNFKHYGINEMLLKVAEENRPYNDPLTFDFKNNNYVQAYNTLFQGIAEFPNDISYFEYANGNTLFAFNLSPDLCNSTHFNDLKDGSVELCVKFAEPTTTPIHAIIYMEFDNILQINKSRVAITNKV